MVASNDHSFLGARTLPQARPERVSLDEPRAALFYLRHAQCVPLVCDKPVLDDSGNLNLSVVESFGSVSLTEDEGRTPLGPPRKTSTVDVLPDKEHIG